MRFSLTFVIASNLLSFSLAWFCTSEVVKADPQPQPAVEVEKEPVKNGVIEYFTMDYCGPCIKFKNSGVIKELEENGWKVVRVKSGKVAPTFTVWVNGESAQFSGFSTKSNFFRTLKATMKDLKNGNRN
jgi:hypothetical protein